MSIRGGGRSLVSVCMPCYNSDKFVRLAIESVLNQTYPHVEIIAVNDGSTDSTLAVLNEFRSERVRVISQSNEGQCAAANRALAAARGELIKFLDADDLLHADMIARQVESLGETHRTVAFGEWARFYRDPEEAHFPSLPMYRSGSPVDWLVSEWRTGYPMTQCAMFLIPRQVLDNAGGWDVRLSLINDFEFFTRVLLASERMTFVPGARMYYRSGINGSLSGQVSRKAAESAALSRILATDHLLKFEDSPRTRKAAATMLQTYEYDFYPDFADLRRDIAARASALGGSDLPPPGPPAFQALRRIVGWRLARQIQRWAERRGLNRTSRGRRPPPSTDGSSAAVPPRASSVAEP